MASTIEYPALWRPVSNPQYRSATAAAAIIAMCRRDTGLRNFPLKGAPRR
jgi:hypothetical protein